VPILEDPDVLDRLTPGQAELVRVLGSSGVPALAGLGAALQTVLTPSANPVVRPLFESNSGVFPFAGDNTQGTVRFDHRLTPAQLITARLNFTRERLANTRLGALAGFNHGSATKWDDGTVTVADNLVLSDRWLAVARGAFSISRFAIAPNDPVGPELIINGYGTFGRDYLYPLRQRERYLDLQLTLSHVRPRHTIKFGGDFNPVRATVDIETFFGGRFIFGEFIPLGGLLGAFTGDPGFAPALRSQLVAAGQPGAAAAIDAPMTALQAFALGLPVAYIQAFGSTFSASTRHQHSLFVEDVFRAHDRVTINAGARLQFNAVTNLESRTYLDPRAGVSWTPSASSVIRAAAGRFHAWVDGTIGYSAKQLQRSDVTNVFVPLSGAFGVVNPATGAPVTSADVYQSLAGRGILGRRPVSLEDLAPLGIRPGIPFPVTGGVDPAFDAPAAQQYSVELERRFGQFLTARAAYNYNRTANLWRTIDRNLKQVGTTPDGWPIFGLVDPTVLNNYVIESTGRGTYHAVTVEGLRRFGRTWTMDAHYTFSRAMDDVTDFNIDYAPHNQLDPAADFGPSLFSAPHAFVATAAFVQSAAASAATWRSGWSASGIVRAMSGRPFNVLTGFDNLGDGQANTHRPLGLGRNAGEGPAFVSVDTRVGWAVDLGRSRTRLQFTLEAFNLFNRVNFSTVNNIVGNTPASALPDPIAGRIDSPVTPLAFTAAHAPRQFQIGVRFTY
jgi:hypothetical protein